MVSTAEFMRWSAIADYEATQKQYKQIREEKQFGFKQIKFKCKRCQAEGLGDFARVDTNAVYARGPCPKCGKPISIKVRSKYEEPLP